MTSNHQQIRLYRMVIEAHGFVITPIPSGRVWVVRDGQTAVTIVRSDNESDAEVEAWHDAVIRLRDRGLIDWPYWPPDMGRAPPI